MATLDLKDTFGALLVGIFFSSVLYGVTCTQVFYYFQNYASDNLIIKMAVITLLILETLHSVFSMHAIYSYTILNYLNPDGLVKATWTIIMTLAVSTAIVLVVQLFYLRRVYLLSKKNIFLVAPLTVLILVRCGFGLAVTVRAFQLEFFFLFPTIDNIVDVSLALGAAADIIIAASLSFYLYSSRSGVESTDTLIKKLMVISINNGLLTSVFDIIVIIFATAQSSNFIYLAIYQVVGNLYTNSMMATLNSRRSLAQGSRVFVDEDSNRPMTTFKVHGASATAQTGDSQFSKDTKVDFIQITSTKDVHVV